MLCQIVLFIVLLCQSCHLLYEWFVLAILIGETRYKMHCEQVEHIAALGVDTESILAENGHKSTEVGG